MNKYVTCVQAKKLKTIGFKEPTDHYYREGKIRKSVDCVNWNILYHILRVSAPTVDEVIDWLRRKFDIHIYTAVEPFVDPTNEKAPILYRFAVKYCDRKNGWNGRIYIGQTRLAENVYSLKRQAITLAIRWLDKRNKKALSKCKQK